MARTSRTWIWEHAAWPRFRWRAADVAPALGAARLAQGKVLGGLRLLDPGLTLEAFSAVLGQDGLTTSAIEGERLDPSVVRSSVARHLGLPVAGLPVPSRAVDGLIEILLDATRNHAKPLTRRRLLGWQAALFPAGRSGLRVIRTGRLRGDDPMQVVSGSAGRERVHFEAPPRKRLDAELDAFLAWLAAPPRDLDGLIRAGLAHLWFVTLHPFEDGNGRLARAIGDLALAQDERQPMRAFSLSAQLLRVRDDYYAVLERTQRDGLDVTEWVTWFLVQVAAAATAADTTIATTLAKARFWLRHQTTDLNSRQRKVLNRLLDAGPDGGLGAEEPRRRRSPHGTGAGFTPAPEPDSFEGGINTRKYMSLTKASRATAYRELSDLVEKRCLTPTGQGGRSTSYQVAW